jgi:hypothetical protein
MENMKYSVWLADQALSALKYYWQVSVALLILSVVSLIIARAKCPKSYFKGLVLNLLPLIGTLTIFAVGVIFRKNYTFAFMTYVGALLVVSLSVLAIFKTKQLWFLSLPITTLILWTSFWFWLVSVMSVSDDWM